MCFYPHHGRFSKADICMRERTVGMQEVTFTLRTLTPLFLAGADQTTAELRAPTFRGLMRYWYRALVGGIVGANERALQEVMAEESAIFGATDTGSAITVRVSEASKRAQRYQKESYSRASTSGKDYLLWSMAESGRGRPDRYKPDRFFFPQNTTFQVSLSSRENDETKLRQAVTALWLLTHLGGIGSRSRRCAGSVAAQVNGENVAAPPFTIPHNVAGLQKQLHEGITYARQSTLQYMLNRLATPITHASFDALAQQTCNVWILRDKKEAWTTPDMAMRALGASLQSYRSQFTLQDREVFGLPLGKNASRRASPLLIRVTEVQEGGYAGVAVLFKTGNPQHYTLIEKWANSFSGKEAVIF